MGNIKTKINHILEQELAKLRESEDRLRYIIDNGPETVDDFEIMLHCTLVTNVLLKARNADINFLI